MLFRALQSSGQPLTVLKLAHESRTIVQSTLRPRCLVCIRPLHWFVVRPKLNCSVRTRSMQRATREELRQLYSNYLSGLDKTKISLVHIESKQGRAFQSFCFYRTAALLALVAASVAASGAQMPSCGCHGKWTAYLAKGLSVELLSKHFEGIVSASGCM